MNLFNSIVTQTIFVASKIARNMHAFSLACRHSLKFRQMTLYVAVFTHCNVSFLKFMVAFILRQFPASFGTVRQTFLIIRTVRFCVSPFSSKSNTQMISIYILLVRTNTETTVRLYYNFNFYYLNAVWMFEVFQKLTLYLIWRIDI